MDYDIERPHRVAIYFAPATDSDWWLSGSEWLGRCAVTGLVLPQSPIGGCTAAGFAALTADPRRYGWHATLKAPFKLAPGQTLHSVRSAIQRLCQGRQPFELAPLRVSPLGQFLALRPTHAQAELDLLAADCVRQFQPLARALSDDELAKRRQANLTPAQDRLLQDWGYPFVFDQYRFHFSLSGNVQGVDPEALASIRDAASQRFHGLGPCLVDRVSLFIEPAPGAPFRLLDQIGFQQ